MNFEAGDTVRHIPTGEEWILLRVQEGYVYPAGWPVSRAKAADCELISKATTEDIAFVRRAGQGGEGSVGGPA